MAPPRKHDTDLILDAARSLVLRDGPRAASVAAIGRESGAPVGTLYHRFGSRDGVLAAAWLRALETFQRMALEAAGDPDPLEAAVQMALAQIRFARENPEDARLLLTLRRRDLLDGDSEDVFRARLDAINAPLQASLGILAERLRESGDPRALDAVTRAVVDLPSATVRRHLREGAEMAAWVEGDIASATRALLSL